jgi:integrase
LLYVQLTDHSPYFNEDSGQATGWDSMWQRLMTSALNETEIAERFTEHDHRGKVGSHLSSIELATDLLGHASKEITKRHYRRKPEVIKPVR